MGGGPPASRPRRVVLLVAPRVFWAPEGPAAREARRPHFVRRRASKPARALRSLRRPPHQWGWVADVWFSASSRSPARPRHRPPAPEVSRVKPPSPLQTGEVCLLKPPSPLRVRNGCFWRIFGLQWCHWFQRWLVWVEQRRHRFHADPTQCCRPWGGLLRGGVYVFVREKVRPARSKWPKIGVFRRAGRVFSHQSALRPGLGGSSVLFRVAAVGVLRHAKRCVGVSPACRTLAWRNSPRLAAAQPRLEGA